MAGLRNKYEDEEPPPNPCPVCGAMLPEDEVFCEECGHEDGRDIPLVVEITDEREEPPLRISLAGEQLDLWLRMEKPQ